MTTCRSPSAARSQDARSDRPMRRWISCVRPDCFPLAASRSVRVCVERGSIPYSAVTQPRPLPFTWLGTRSSAVAVQRTRVRPNAQRTLPSACSVKPVTSSTRRSSSIPRPCLGITGLLPRRGGGRNRHQSAEDGARLRRTRGLRSPPAPGSGGTPVGGRLGGALPVERQLGNDHLGAVAVGEKAPREHLLRELLERHGERLRDAVLVLLLGEERPFGRM